MQVNKYNFLRWFDGAPVSGQPEIPVGYWRDRTSCGFMPVAYPTEAMAFYINTPAGANYGTFADLRLSLRRADTNAVVDPNILGLSQHLLTAPNYNFYATIVLPAMSQGLHYFRIYDSVSGNEILRSSYILARNDKTNLDIETIYCRFRHDRFFYNIPYAGVPGFYQQFRLQITQLERQVQSDKEVYKEVTTGKQRTFENYLSRWRKFEAYYFDPPAHEAAALMIEHDFFEFNGQRYRVKASYKEPADVRSKIGKGEFEAWEEEFDSVNRC